MKNTFVRPAARTSASSTYDGRTPPSDRPRWAMAGWIAGLLSVLVFGVAPAALYVPTEALIDNVELVEHLEGTEGFIWLFQASTFAVAVLVVVFGLGLRRRLAGQTPADSLLADLAAAGMLLIAALTLVGGGISTEMFASVRHLDEVDPDTIATHLTLFNTMAWVWAGGVLTTASVAIAAFRHGAVGRGLGWFAAVMSGIVLLTQIVPLQYMATAPIVLFLVVAGIAMQREDVRERNARRADSRRQALS